MILPNSGSIIRLWYEVSVFFKGGVMVGNPG